MSSLPPATHSFVAFFSLPVFLVCAVPQVSKLQSALLTSALTSHSNPGIMSSLSFSHPTAFQNLSPTEKFTFDCYPVYAIQVSLYFFSNSAYFPFYALLFWFCPSLSFHSKHVVRFNKFFFSCKWQ